MSDESQDDRQRRREEHEENENHERWLVSYADFITLLFAFFVVMYATSSNNQDKQKSFEESVRVNLRLGGAGSTDNQANHADGYIGGHDSATSFIPIDGFPHRGGPGETEQYIERVIENNLTSGEKEKIQALRHDAIGVRIELASSQFFLPGGTKLRTSALSSLDKIAAILKETDKKVVIEGHTDNTPVIAGAPYESNWELSSLRATSIVRYLIKYHGISPQRISAMSYAETRPLATNTTPEGRSRNRRIEIYMILDEKLQSY